MVKVPDWLKIAAASVGGWLVLMSGALSAASSVFSFFVGGNTKVYSLIVAFVALWVLAFGAAWRNYKLMQPKSVAEPQLSDAAMELLLESAKGSDIVYVEGYGGASIMVGNREFVKPFGDARSRAIYTSALDELEAAGCITKSGMFLRLTAKGYAIADSKLGRK
jgi:hypothetical protein